MPSSSTVSSRWKWKALSASLALALLFSAGPARAWETQCHISIPATMVDSVDSGTAYPGMKFRFHITTAVNFFGTILPAGTLGYGYVREVTGASNRNRNGSLILEMRALVYKNKIYDVMVDPRDSSVWSPAMTVGERASDYLPIPGILRTAVNEVRNGKNITIGPGFQFHVVALGDPRKYAPCIKIGQ